MRFPWLGVWTAAGALVGGVVAPAEMSLHGTGQEVVANRVSTAGYIFGGAFIGIAVGEIAAYWNRRQGKP